MAPEYRQGGSNAIRAPGRVPAKRHVAFRENGTLLTEEVMGFEGFSGNESILYHLQTPCRVTELGSFTAIEREEWVPAAHAHRLFDTRARTRAATRSSGAALLMYNDDVEIAVCRPREAQEYFYRNGEGDEVIFVHEGRGELETTFGTLPYREHDYIVIPRGTTYRFAPDGEQLWLTFHTPGEIETPNRYRNRYGQLLEHAPYSHRDFHPPAELVTHREPGDYELVRPRPRRLPALRPGLPPARRRRLGRLRVPVHVQHRRLRADRRPRAHAAAGAPDLPGAELRHLLVLPADARLGIGPTDPAIPIPYNHSNLQSEEMIYYVSGEFGSRRGVDVGSITLHPSGLPHGPQPGLAEKSIGQRCTDELAVMCDTFRPLRLTALCAGHRRWPLRAVVGRRRRSPRRWEPVFEEAQLYAPITTAADGAVTVHLDEDHPGLRRSRVPRTAQPHRRPGAGAGTPRSRSPTSTTPRRSRRSGGRSAGSWRPSTSGSPARSTARRWPPWRSPPTTSPSSTRSARGCGR